MKVFGLSERYTNKRFILILLIFYLALQGSLSLPLESSVLRNSEKLNKEQVSMPNAITYIWNKKPIILFLF